jgi:NAD+ synthase (glutamine-hydrolysing)
MLTIARAQYDFLVGDLAATWPRHCDLVSAARDAGADRCCFRKWRWRATLEDLLLRRAFLDQAEQALAAAAGVHRIDVVIGHPWRERGERHNAVSWIREGRVLGRYAKQYLPNYRVFDEKRYFRPAASRWWSNSAGCASA